MRKILTLLCFCLLASIAGVALAQTPDGETPAQETVCDDPTIVGAAFGLCNAYCEAMDCDCPTAADPNCAPQASSTACARVGDRLTTVHGFIPCAPDLDCPCDGFPTATSPNTWSDDPGAIGSSFAGLLWDSYVLPNSVYANDTTGTCTDSGGVTTLTLTNPDGSSTSVRVDANNLQCAAIDPPNSTSGTLTITAAQAIQCRLDLRAAAASNATTSDDCP